MTSAIGSAYSVTRATGLCAATGRALAPGERCMATLLETPGSSEWRRADFALDAWAAGARPEQVIPGARLFASWHTVVPEPNAKKQSLLSDDELLDLFDQLDAATDARKVAFRYVLALMLVRKRLLKYEGQRGESMLVRRAGAANMGGDPVRVTDPGMDDAAVADAIEQLGETMGLGPQTPGPAGGGNA